jgi:hypothetical protein
MVIVCLNTGEKRVSIGKEHALITLIMCYHTMVHLPKHVLSYHGPSTKTCVIIPWYIYQNICYHTMVHLPKHVLSYHGTSTKTCVIIPWYIYENMCYHTRVHSSLHFVIIPTYLAMVHSFSQCVIIPWYTCSTHFHNVLLYHGTLTLTMWFFPVKSGSLKGLQV